MKRIWMFFFAALVLRIVLCSAIAEQTSPSPEATHILTAAKSVYLVSGHVRHFKRTFLKSELVDETPFAEPAQKELEKWGRFKVVIDPKQADLVVRVYMSGSTQSVPVMTPGVTGSVSVGQVFTVLDVLEPRSNKVLWYDAKNDAHAWSTQTAVEDVFKKFREFVEQHEKSFPPASSGGELNNTTPVVIPVAGGISSAPSGAP